MDRQLQLDDAASADLLQRGYNRRDLGRIAALLGVGAAVAKPAWAIAAPGPAPKVMIDSNECWTGPMEPGQAAARAIIARSNRYEPGNERDKFIAAAKGMSWVSPRGKITIEFSDLEDLERVYKRIIGR